MLIDGLAVAILIVGIVNLLHWITHGRRRAGFPTGKLGMLFKLLLFSQLVFAVLMLVGLISDGLFLSALGIYAIADGVYSINRRQMLGRDPAAA